MLKPDSIVGKTVKSVNAESFNAWLIEFTDGTSMVIDTEPGPAGIPGITFNETEAYGDAFTN